MKIAIVSVLSLAAAGLGLAALSQGSDDNKTAAGGTSVQEADALYKSVRKARADLREMRIAAGLHAHAAGPHIDPEGHHEGDSPEQRKRESSEGEGHEDGEGHEGRGERGHGEGREGGERGHGEGREGGERGHGEGREGGERGHGEGREGGERGHEGRSEGTGRIAKGAKHVKTYRNGARLTLQYNPRTEAFIGSVTNTTKKPLPDMRVEIHLDNGVELGPTKRVNLAPGKTIPVELGAFGESFRTWVTHPESGVEAGHGPGGEEDGAAHEERERGEHGGRRERGGEHGGEGRGEGGGEAKSAQLAPVHNQLRLLHGELKAFRADLAAKSK